MASGNAIRGSRVGAGPMGEAERGDAAPRICVSYWCAKGHETTAELRRGAGPGLPDTWDCPRCGYPAGQDQTTRRPAQDGALQDPPGLREGAALRRRRRGDPRRGARHPAPARPHPVGPAQPAPGSAHTLTSARTRRTVRAPSTGPRAPARGSDQARATCARGDEAARRQPRLAAAACRGASGSPRNRGRRSPGRPTDPHPAPGPRPPRPPCRDRPRGTTPHASG